VPRINPGQVRGPLQRATIEAMLGAWQASASYELAPETYFYQNVSPEPIAATLPTTRFALETLLNLGFVESDSEQKLLRLAPRALTGVACREP
jgi:hypothetical protein